MLIAGKMRAQEGFSLVELLVVIAIIGMSFGVGIIMVVRSSAGYSRRSTAEIVKQELGKVYSLADDAVRNPVGAIDDNQKKRDRYKLVFHDNTGNPPNAYKIVKNTWNGTAYVATDVTPYKREVNKIVAGFPTWVSPSRSSDIRIVIPASVADVTGEYRLIFQSKGSVMTVDTEPTGAAKWVAIKAISSGLTSTIDVSDYGETPPLQGGCGAGAGASVLSFGLMMGLLGVAGSAWVRKRQGWRSRQDNMSVRRFQR